MENQVNLEQNKQNVNNTNIPKNPSAEDVAGKILGRLGIGAILLGVIFFLKYAFDNNWIGPEGRVAMGVVAGLGLLGLGHFLRAKYTQYSDLLMGGGAGIIYLSIFAAYGFYNLIDPFTTLAISTIVSIFIFAVSVIDASLVLSFIASMAGFIAPLAFGIKDFGGTMMLLYLTILNILILAISLFKKWHKLIAVAVVGSFINFSSWMGVFYTVEDKISPLLFILFTFLIFNLAILGRNIYTQTKADTVDYLLLVVSAVFLVVYFTELFPYPEYKHILAFGSVALALFYLSFAFLANQKSKEDAEINIALPALAVTFLSIALPLEFSGQVLTVAWMVEAVSLYIMAAFISNRGFQVMGILTYIFGIMCYLINIADSSSYLKSDFITILNNDFLTGIFVAFCTIIIALIYKKFGSSSVEIQKRGILVYSIVAVVFVFLLGNLEIGKHYANIDHTYTQKYYKQIEELNMKYGSDYNSTEEKAEIREQMDSFRNKTRDNKSIATIVFWILYAVVTTAIGFARRNVGARRLGFVLFLLSAFNIFFTLWSFGELYRIVSSIVFGVFALATSFAYLKYKDRLKEII